MDLDDKDELEETLRNREKILRDAFLYMDYCRANRPEPLSKMVSFFIRLCLFVILSTLVASFVLTN